MAGVGVKVRVGFKDSVGVQSGQTFPSSAFDACEASGAFGTHGLLRPVPLTTNCWPEPPLGGGWGGSWRPRACRVAHPVAAPHGYVQAQWQSCRPVVAFCHLHLLRPFEVLLERVDDRSGSGPDTSSEKVRVCLHCGGRENIPCHGVCYVL